MARRLLATLLGLYLTAAIVGRLLEAVGATRCGCADDCWCKKAGLSTFRWVFPWRHRRPIHRPRRQDLWLSSSTSTAAPTTDRWQRICASCSTNPVSTPI